MFNAFSLVGFILAFCFLPAARTDIYVENGGIECQRIRATLLRCQNYTIELKPRRDWTGYRSFVLVEWTLKNSTDVLEVSKSSGLDNGVKKPKWTITIEIPEYQDVTHILLATRNTGYYFGENSNERTVGYVTDDIMTSFYTSHISREIGKLTKIFLNNSIGVNVSIDMSEDRKISKFAADRHIGVRGSTKLSCLQWHQKWTSGNCEVINSNLTTVTCKCVFINVSMPSIAAETTMGVLPHSRSLLPLNFATTLIATVFFVTTFLLLLRFRKALKDGNKRFEIQINLTISLLMRHTFLTVGVSVALFDPLNRTFCEAAAVLHLYFLMTSVLWVLMEGVMIYRKVCRSALSFPKVHLCIAASLTWGVPLVLMAAVAALELSKDSFIMANEPYLVVKKRLQAVTGNSGFVEKELLNYRKYDFCWTTSSIASFALGIPVTLALLVNTAILIWVGIVVWKIGKADRKNLPSDSANSELRRSSLPTRQTMVTFRAVVILTAVLGIPWLFSLLYNIADGVEKKYSLAPSFVHSILIFLQGPMLFYLYCIQNQEFRRVFRRKIEAEKAKRIVVTKKSLSFNQYSAE